MGGGWGRERDDVACVVVARYVLWVVERDWWARHYTGRVAVTSYGAATQAVSGCTNVSHSVWTASANGSAVKSLSSYSGLNSVSYCNIVEVV